MEEKAKKESLKDRIRETILSENNLEYLDKLDSGELELLAKEIDDYNSRTRENQKPVYQTMAFTSQFLPNFMVAKISQEMLTPYIIGQVTNHFKPKDAAKIAVHFRKDFLGEVSVYAEKSHLALITQELPFDTAFSVFQEMLKKEYYSRIGELADLLPAELLVRFLKKFPDHGEIEKIIHHMQNTELVSEVLKKVGYDSRE